MRQKYLNMTRDPFPLPTFFVSNSEYLIHTIGYERKAPPKMSVEVTEIPKLRAFLYGLPATRKFRAFEHYRKVVIPSLLNITKMTCSQTRLMRRGELHKIILSSSQPVPGEIHKMLNTFFENIIFPCINTIRARKDIYADHTSKKVPSWRGWPNQTHKTFYQHLGNWSTKKVGKHDWNKEMLAPLVCDVEKGIRGWGDAFDTLSTSLSDMLSTITNDLISQFEGTVQYQSIHVLD